MKSSPIAVDFGTTNSVVARWNEETDSPEIIRLTDICRGTSSKKDIDDSYTIPSCVYLLPPAECLKFPFNIFCKKMKNKTGGLIGSQALRKDGGLFKSWFVDNFKSHLGKNSFQLIAKLNQWTYTAREITAIFLKTLFLEIRKKGIKPGNVTFCVPVDFYEVYRAHLKRISSKLNVSSIKTIDEPVAAALGYGIDIDDAKNILVIDFGAGTLDIALIEVGERKSKKGRCTVIAKTGAPIGGNLVDAWIVEALCQHYGYNVDHLSNDPNIRWWYRILLSEACRLKETLFLKESETFYLMPARMIEAASPSLLQGKRRLKEPVDFTRTQLIDLLQQKGLYSILNNMIEEILTHARTKGYRDNTIDEVLMVGGSTLLPQVYSTIENFFGRDKVRAWQPFNAVAFGAATFAAGRFHKTDYITHDYAFVTYNPHTHKPQYQVIIPKGTIYPTTADFWKKQLIPTCALGEPETIFKMVICEIGTKHAFEQEFAWDKKGELHILENDENKALIFPLNESDPTLGHLDPPHYPSEKRARVEISFMVNEDRWLCTTVYDLKTHRTLLQDKPVIRLK